MFWLAWNDGEGAQVRRYTLSDSDAGRYLALGSEARSAWRTAVEKPDETWTLAEPTTLGAFESARTAIVAGTATDAEIQTYLAYLGP